MQQLVANDWVYRHTESELSLRPDQTACTLNKATPQGVKAREVPKRRALLKGSTRRRMGDHLQLSAQVVGQED